MRRSPPSRSRHPPLPAALPCPSGLQANRVCLVLCLIIVGTFQHSSNLTSVYGACVSSAMFITTMLWIGVLLYCHGWSPLATAAVGLPLMLMDGALVTANIAKYFISGPLQLSFPEKTSLLLQRAAVVGEDLTGPVPGNGWVAMLPLMITTLLFAAMCSWAFGSRIVSLELNRLTSVVIMMPERPSCMGGGAAEVGDTAASASVSVHLRLPPRRLHHDFSGERAGLYCVCFRSPAPEFLLHLPGRAPQTMTIRLASVSRDAILKEALASTGAGGRDATKLQRYAALEEFLLTRQAAACDNDDAPGRSWCRPRGLAVYVCSGASFADTEPITAVRENALSLPRAFLRAIQVRPPPQRPASACTDFHHVATDRATGRKPAGHVSDT